MDKNLPEGTEKYSFEDWLQGYVRTVSVDVRIENRDTAIGKHLNRSILFYKKAALEVLDPRPKEHILDLGCATGAMTVYCTMLGASCVGVDLSVDSLNVAKTYLLSNGFKQSSVIAGDVGYLPFPDASFDKAISCDLYEHLPPETKIKLLNEVYRILKPGGYFVLKTPNLCYLRLSLFYKRLRALVRFENPMKFVIPHTRSADGDKAEHIGLATPFAIERDLRQTVFFDYRFCYGLGTKVKAVVPTLNRIMTTEIPVLRDMFVEEVIVKATKSKIADFLPD